MVEISTFGRLSDGSYVTMYTILNRKGESVSLLDYGAAIHAVCVNDFREQKSNVVLNVAEAEELEGFSAEAVTIGRVANRIKNGRYIQDGIPVQLEKNYKNTHFIHGGSGNYAHRFFIVDSIEKNSVRMSLRDNGEGGFPCGADVAVTFSFDDSSTLSIRYAIMPDKNTVFSPTNHAYWNLSGGDAASQGLEIRASFYAPRSSEGMPEGDILPVDHSPMDFRRGRILSEALSSSESGFFQDWPPKYDDNLILDGEGLRQVARLYAEDTRRSMEVYSDLPALVLFTPPCPGSDTYRAVCLETQFVSNAVNHSSYEQPFCRGGEKTEYITIYRFSCQ